MADEHENAMSSTPQSSQVQSTGDAASDPRDEPLELDSATGKISYQIIATLIGGLLLICSLVARLIWDGGYSASEPGFYSDFLALAAAILLGAPLVVKAGRDIIRGQMHMNELVALAVLAAFATQRYQESAAIAFFMILSALIENRTALGAQASIESLVKITPTRACRITDGNETQVEAKDLVPGDIVRVLPGDNIPADGRVVRGQSTVNQAHITGESLPIDKSEDDEVFGGTINVTGVLEIEVTKAGADTTLGRVKDLILQAERSRIPIMRLIDQYAGWYTPTVLMIVAIVLPFNIKAHDPNEAFMRAISMLVAACPFAVILATPTAMVAALSSAARLGVLIKNVVDLEGARNLTAMIFDKTGTLTTGNLSVSKLTPHGDVEGAELLKTAAAVEQNSRHPVARAVVEVARKAELKLSEPTDFEEVAGRGVRGTIDGQLIFVGRAAWLTDGEVVQLSGESIAAINEAQSSPQAEGLSVLFVVRAGALLGWVGLEDNARDGAAEAIDELRKSGLKNLTIVTGDRESVAKRVAAQMHMTNFAAEVLPHEKLELVRELKAKGHRVAVVGDGVNDAPALAAGDISIAMGAAGSDVAIHSASIALMNNNLNRIPFLIGLSKHTMRVIMQNLTVGGGFIVVFMVLGAMGMPAIVTAALHVFSSLIVVFNSARLVREGEQIEQSEAQTTARQRPERTSMTTQAVA
jgi:Cd2+/Zn2+-exporting ATPase